jgi:hypothetical protein
MTNNIRVQALIKTLHVFALSIAWIAIVAILLFLIKYQPIFGILGFILIIFGAIYRCIYEDLKG